MPHSTLEELKRPFWGHSLLLERPLYKGILALTLLAAFSSWVYLVCWRAGGNYEMDGDGTRYMQIAMQMVDFHRVGLMPEFGPDISRIYPPLLPIFLAISRLFTGEYYRSAHGAEAVTLALAVLAAFSLGWRLSKNWISAFCAGAAVAFFLGPRYIGLVLTEPLNAAALLGATTAMVACLQRRPDADLTWAWVGAACSMAAILSRSVGVVLIPGMAVGLALTFPRAELYARRRPLALIFAGWLAGVVMYVAYAKYQEHIGGIPLEALLHAYSATLDGQPSIWPVIAFDQQTGLSTPVPGAYSIFHQFWVDPNWYLKTCLIAFGSIFSQWTMLLGLLHGANLLYRNKYSSNRMNLWAVCDIALLVMLALLILIVGGLGQYPVHVPRMFEPWAVCSIAVLVSFYSLALMRALQKRFLAKILLASALALIALT